MDGRTNGQTDRQTDGRTDKVMYRGACYAPRSLNKTVISGNTMVDQDCIGEKMRKYRDLIPNSILSFFSSS